MITCRTCFLLSVPAPADWTIIAVSHLITVALNIRLLIRRLKQEVECVSVRGVETECTGPESEVRPLLLSEDEVRVGDGQFVEGGVHALIEIIVLSGVGCVERS